MHLGPQSLRIEIVLLSTHYLLDGVMDKALTFYAEGPRFNSQLGQWNSFKKLLFLIEDTSQLEC